MDGHTNGVREGILKIVLFPGGPHSTMTAAMVLEEVVVDGLPEFSTAFDVLFDFLYAHCSPTMSIRQGPSISLRLCKNIFLFLDSGNSSSQIQTLTTKSSHRQID